MATTTTSRVRTARRLVLVLAVLQPVGSAVFTRWSPVPLDSGPTNQAAVTPAGYAFAVWGLITALCVVVAVLIAARGLRVAREAWVLGHLAVLFAGFNVWLGFAALAAYWATVVVFAVMVVAALRVVLHLASHEVGGPAWWGPLLRGTVGLYAGWATVASFVNVAAALIAGGVDLDTRAGTAVQLALIAGAVVVAVWAQRASRGNLGYAAGLLWALVAATIGAADASGLLALAAAAACVVVLAVEVTLRARGARSAS
jgi:hypothetical protein